MIFKFLNKFPFFKFSLKNYPYFYSILSKFTLSFLHKTAYKDNFLRKIILKNKRTKNKDKIKFSEINFENKHKFYPFL
jgi:hypothetical protein